LRPVSEGAAGYLVESSLIHILVVRSADRGRETRSAAGHATVAQRPSSERRGARHISRHKRRLPGRSCRRRRGSRPIAIGQDEPQRAPCDDAVQGLLGRIAMAEVKDRRGGAWGENSFPLSPALRFPPAEYYCLVQPALFTPFAHVLPLGPVATPMPFLVLASPPRAVLVVVTPF